MSKSFSLLRMPRGMRTMSAAASRNCVGFSMRVNGVVIRASAGSCAVFPRSRVGLVFLFVEAFERFVVVGGVIRLAFAAGDDSLWAGAADSRCGMHELAVIAGGFLRQAAFAILKDDAVVRKLQTLVPLNSR